MGGRLALHAVLRRPALWRGAIVISADPGLGDPILRAQRLKQDRQWGDRFLNESWPKLMAAWDGQAVFAGRPNANPPREQDFSRRHIARAFDVYSKGRQDFLLEPLAQLKAPPILFISGTDDVRYSNIGHHLAQTVPVFSHAAIERAAHRVPWENPRAFVAVVQAFIDGVG